MLTKFDVNLHKDEVIPAQYAAIASTGDREICPCDLTSSFPPPTEVAKL